MKFRFWILLFSLVSLSSFSIAFNEPTPTQQEFEASEKKFSKFTKDFPLRYTTYSDQAKPQIQKRQKFFFILFKSGLELAKDKENYLKYIFSFVDHPYHRENTIPAFVFFDLFNRHGPVFSEISFEKVLAELKNNQILQRYSWEFNEHSDIIHMNTQTFSEFAIGDYLFGFVRGLEDSYQALRILKAWDTHRQEFAQIQSDQDLMATLAIKNKKLQIQLTTEDFEDSLYVGPNLTFQLNQDRSRSLISCTEKNKKTWISTCDNPKISITTTLK